MLRRFRNWKWACWGALAVTLLCLYPQFVMWATRGREWNGAYAQVHGDEWLYSGYVQALIDGRPRRNDPYTGRDDRPGETQPESIFSIQFIPAYMIAIPARMAGVSSSTAFIVVGILNAFFSCLAIFWLLRLLTDDERIAAAGAVIVLCFGALAGGQGVIHLLESHAHYIYLPFQRRHAPAVTFPLFFIFCGLVWKSLTSERRLIFGVAAGAALAIMLFSYFYLWTAALAWLVGLALIWLAARREWKRSLLSVGPIFVLFSGAAVPYLILVSHRMRAMDAGLKIQGMHTPDLLRAPEIAGFIAIALLVYGAARGILDWRAPETLFAASFGLLPFLVFNQQVITGTSLQPYHYSLFIANYVSLIGIVLSVFLLWRARRQVDQPVRYRRLARFVVLALWWGAVEVAVHTRVIMRESQLKDSTAAACRRLRQLSANDVLTSGRDPRPLVLAMQDDLAVMIPTFAPQALLWSHNFDFLNIEAAENRRRLYQYLYYSGFDGAALREDLAKPVSRFGTALFGVERVIAYISAGKPQPITQAEIDEQVQQYESFIASFNRDTANEHVLSYVVFPVRQEPNLTNLDKWYERDQGEQVEGFKIFRVRVKT